MHILSAGHHDCTHKLTAAVVSCTRPEQDGRRAHEVPSSLRGYWLLMVAGTGLGVGVAIFLCGVDMISCLC